MAEPAYAYPSSRRSAAQPEALPSERVRLTVVPGQANQRQARRVVLPVSTLVVLVVSILILAIVPFARIWLANDTMLTLVATNKLDQLISTSRAQGHSLESRYSAMTNPQTIKRQAEQLGMVPDPDPEFVQLTNDPAELAWDPLAQSGSVGALGLSIGLSVGDPTANPLADVVVDGTSDTSASDDGSEPAATSAEPAAADDSSVSDPTAADPVDQVLDDSAGTTGSAGSSNTGPFTDPLTDSPAPLP